MSESETAQGSVAELAIVPDVPLDQLFAELAKEATATAQEKGLANIQDELANLPKIESNLERDMKNAAQEKTLSLVVRVNDPIAVQRKERDKDADAGARWFHMKKPELTPEIKRDLLILKNRSALDPKRHYKKEKWEIPQYFQSGTIIEGNTEFYSARIARRNRGKTLAEEILNDGASSTYFKKKYSEIQKVNKSGGKKHYKKIKEKRRGY